MAKGGRKSGKYVRSCAQPSIEAAIAALAARQHGLLTLPQLNDLGLSASAVHKRAAVARLHRIYPRVYALVPRSLLTRHGHWMAAVLACGPGAVLSHRTAAALHELRETQRAKIEVTVPRRSRPEHRRIDIHRSTTLTAADVTIVNRIPCTSVARTMFDLAEVVSRRAVERAFDQSEIIGVFDLRAVEDQLRRNPTRPGARLVQSILADHYIGSSLTQSELEEAVLSMTQRLGLPDPLINHWIDFKDGGPMILADFVWPRQRVILEADGVRFHGTGQARERDPRRDQRALIAGWRPVRTTWRQVTRRPQELEPTLLALVAVPPPGANGSPAAAGAPVPPPPGTRPGA